MNRPTSIQKGWVYVLRNPAHKKNLFKVGYTSRTIEERLAELETTGTPLPFEAILQVLVSNPKKLEGSIHELLAEYRVNESREFFEIEPNLLIDKIKGYIDENRNEYNPTDFWALDNSSLSEDFWWELKCPDCQKKIALSPTVPFLDLYNSPRMQLTYGKNVELYQASMNFEVNKHFIHVCEDYFTKPQAFHPLRREYITHKTGKIPSDVLTEENNELYFFNLDKENRLDDGYGPPIKSLEDVPNEEHLDLDTMWKLKRRFPYSFFVSGDLPYFTVQKDGYYYCDNEQKEVATEDSNYRETELPFAFEWRLPISFFKDQPRYPIEIPWEVYSPEGWRRAYTNISYRELAGLDEKKSYSVIYDMFSFKFLE